ncbi:MAG: hypothetical protein WDN69_08740 [Aliidongia sp.]
MFVDAGIEAAQDQRELPEVGRVLDFQRDLAGLASKVTVRAELRNCGSLLLATVPPCV